MRRRPARWASCCWRRRSASADGLARNSVSALTQVNDGVPLAPRLARMNGFCRRKFLSRAAGTALAGVVPGLLLAGCSSTQSVSSDFPAASRELHLRAGDVIKLVTVNRQRFRIRILEIGPEGLRGEVLESRQSTLPAGGTADVAYADMALLQEEHVGAGRSFGAVAVVGLVGAVVVSAMFTAAMVGIPAAAVPPP